MNRRDFFMTLAGTMFARPLDVAAQRDKAVTIGLLSTSFAQRRGGVQAFTEGLKKLGYIEGRNLTIKVCDGGGRNDRLAAFAADLVDRRVDIIVPLGPYAIEAARQATATIPIVFAGIGANFELARNEGNITGVVEELIESTTKRLAILREALPSLSRLGIIANPDNYGTNDYLRECRAWALAVGATITVYDVRDPHDIAPAFAEMTNDCVDALVAFPDSVIFGQRDQIVETALRLGLPGVYVYREWVEAGGLMAYGANQRAILGEAVPLMVDRIIRGAKPADLPIEHGRMELFINLKVARAMEIPLPASLLARAHELIEPS